jgi:hypothetical protein
MFTLCLAPVIVLDLVALLRFIALMMEEVNTSETLVNLYQSTRRYNPEDRLFIRDCLFKQDERIDHCSGNVLCLF